MGRGKFKGKPTGRRHFSTPEELIKPKNLKAKMMIVEIEKQKAHERYMKLQEHGKTEQSRKDLVISI
uniref:Casein kinase substrate phosphoprotein PP28 domain-containing protein n=1 Tax=Populus trichocarpa TaxID=3694 RepID=A0A2K2C9Y6_POPTR